MSCGHILIAEDDPALRRFYVRALGGMGHTVETVPDGESALRSVQAKRFDVVLSDMMMPGMDGLDLLRAIRAHDLDVPVVLATGAPSIESAVRAVEDGAFRYLSKPVAMDALTKVVETAVDVCRTARATRQMLAEAGELAHQVGDHAGLVVKFEAALEKLWMAYQPIVQWSQRRVYAYEALARSAEPTLPHPGALFDAAERLGETLRLARAIRAHASLPLAGNENLLFVNLNTEELQDERLFAEDCPLRPFANRISLEITERVSLDRIENVRERIAALRALGFRIALDDIGAGYAGLSTFAVLEPDIVKLDMSLVRGIQSSATKRALVRSMATVCEGTGAVMIAEGVESAEELQALVDLGCDFFQGYLFARPGPAFPTVTWPDSVT